MLVDHSMHEGEGALEDTHAPVLAQRTDPEGGADGGGAARGKNSA